MRRFSTFRWPTTPRRLGLGRLAPVLALVLGVAVGADDLNHPAEPETNHDPATTAGPSNLEQAVSTASIHARRLADEASAWYRRTPPADRITWGGLAACALLGLGVLGERSLKLRRGRVLPARFVERFRDRLRDGDLEPVKGADLCELNPSPASRIVLAALRRWGRPASDLERAVELSRKVEEDRLRRNVGTLRRIAALAPLIGLLGTLLSAGRALSSLGDASGAAAAAAASASASASWGPALASSLAPLTAGVALAILALVAYDGLIGKIETLGGALDRLGAETVDAIAVVSAPKPPLEPTAPSSPRHSTPAAPHFGMAPSPRRDRDRDRDRDRGSRTIRVEIPDSLKDY